MQTQGASANSQRSRRPLAIIVVVAVAVLAGLALLVLQPWKGDDAGSAGSSESSEAQENSRTVTGTFTLFDTDMIGCNPQGGYGDIGPGTPVTLKNETGTIIGSTSLGTGDAGSGSCTWTYSFPGVSTEFTYYTVTVGTRGDITNSKSEMEANGWTFATTLGL